MITWKHVCCMKPPVDCPDVISFELTIKTEVSLTYRHFFDITFRFSCTATLTLYNESIIATYKTFYIFDLPWLACLIRHGTLGFLLIKIGRGQLSSFKVMAYWSEWCFVLLVDSICEWYWEVGVEMAFLGMSLGKSVNHLLS